MFTPISLLAVLAASVAAAPSALDRRSCPTGYIAGSTTTTVTFPVPMQTLESVVKSFFNGTWEGVDVTATSGTDDTLGATRSFLNGGVVPVTEQLITFQDKTPYTIVRVWVGIGGATAADPLPVISAANNIAIRSWTEEFTLTPACNFAATTFKWTASYCTNNSAVADAAYTAAHTVPLNALVAQYGQTTPC